MGPPERAHRDALVSDDLLRMVQPALDNLFEICPDGIFLTDSGGVIRRANPSAAALFGYTEIELVGTPIEKLIPERLRVRHPDQREAFHAAPRARRMGAAVNLFALRKDGTEFPVDIMLRPIATSAGPLVLSFVRDISDFHAASEESDRLEQQLSLLVESVGEYAIYLLDSKGCVTSWNPGAERIKQYKKEEILGLSFSRFFTQEDIERGHPAQLLTLAAVRGRVEEAGWRVRKDGSRFWADVILTAIRDKTGTLTGYAKVTRDITDRKRAEEAVMLELTTALLANVDLRRLLEAMAASISAFIPHDSATLSLFDPHSGSLLTQFLSGDRTNPLRRDVKLPVMSSPAGAAFRTRQPVLVENISLTSFDPETVRHHTSLGMQSGCWVPLVYQGQAIGAMAVCRRSVASFTAHEANMLMKIADQVAMAVGHGLAFQRVEELRDRLRQEKQYLEDQINLEHSYEDIVGKSARLRQVLDQIASVAPTDSTVLIEGETGTGKELLARAIHRASRRKERSFIKLNCASIPAGLIESELFGHEKGAFSGAIARKIGLVELAHEGTLFLDEIGELPLELQPKLLRALQEREITRVGGNRPIRLDIRLIAATNRNLAHMVATNRFRNDLYYRLKVFPIYAPPLRERDGDIPILVRHFVSVHNRRLGRSIEIIPDETMDALARWKWPGNIRELENILERSVILTRGPVLYVPLGELESPQEDSDDSPPENATLEDAERAHIIAVLREVKGHVSSAAERLGLKRTTLYSKMTKRGIQRADYI